MARAIHWRFGSLLAFDLDRANSLLDYAAKVTNKGQFKVLVSDLKQ